MMIYFELLTNQNDKTLHRAGLWLQQQNSSIILTSQLRQSGIDHAILHTCRLAYIEAATVLYQRNLLEFHSFSELADFRAKGLSKVVVGHNSDQSQILETLFYFQPTPRGRLSTIGNLSLVFTDVPDQTGPVPHRRPRDSVLKAWSELLFQDRQSNENAQYSFPCLVGLKMDFQQLALSDKEGIVVCEKLKLLDQLASTMLRLMISR